MIKDEVDIPEELYPFISELISAYNEKRIIILQYAKPTIFQLIEDTEESAKEVYIKYKNGSQQNTLRV